MLRNWRGWMCCIYLYVPMMTRPFFRLPRGGCPSQVVSCVDHHITQAAPGVNGQQPGPTVIDCICVVYTLRIRCAPPSFSPFNWTASQFERNKISFLWSSCYFAAFRPLASPPPKLMLILLGPSALVDFSSIYFFVQPKPCFNNIIDLTAFRPPQFGCVTK